MVFSRNEILNKPAPVEIFSSIWTVIQISPNLSSTVKPIFYNPSLSLPPSHCRCGTLGTVCAESCGYRTMTGWTKLTTNEITLWECDTPGWGEATQWPLISVCWAYGRPICRPAWTLWVLLAEFPPLGVPYILSSSCHHKHTGTDRYW